MSETRIKQFMTNKVVRYVAPQHTCLEYMATYAGDGPSPSEVCEVCRCSLAKQTLNISLPIPSRQSYQPLSSTYSLEVRRTAEQMILDSKNATLLMEFDQHFGIERPWWFYQDIMEDGFKTIQEREEESEKWMEDFKATKAKQAEFGYWYANEEAEAKRKLAEEDLKAYRDKLAGIMPVELPDNMRQYIRSVDGRSGKVKEVEFEGWLAIPKNKRHIYLEGGKLGPAVPKADIGSVVIKSCPPSVLLSDIRVVLAKFGGVRDVYRPKDKVTGKSKPFVFVEMLKNAEAWAAVDYFAKHPFVLDEHTFAIQGAGERKTSVEMAAIQPAKVSEASTELPTELKQTPQPPKLALPPRGAFSALCDSDSD